MFFIWGVQLNNQNTILEREYDETFSFPWMSSTILRFSWCGSKFDTISASLQTIGIFLFKSVKYQRNDERC